MTLVEFLLARLAEDEDSAQSVLNKPAYFQGVAWGWFDDDFGDFHIAEYGKDGVGLPARVLAEVEAKRKVVAYAAFMLEAWEAKGAACAYPDMTRRERHSANVTLELLASPYVDHPDFDPDWKPEGEI